MSINFTKIYKKYSGLWVALSDDEKRVLGSGKTAKAALQVAYQKGKANPILFRVPSKLMSYIGCAL